MKYELPQLDYKFNQLEPFMDAQTVEIHYGKHHLNYINNLNAVLEKNAELSQRSLESLLKNLDKLPADISSAIKNNGGGHYNHTLFWKVLKSPAGESPSGKFLKELEKAFGGFEQFKTLFEDAGKKHFGSGWVWLIKNLKGELQIVATPNQDTPLTIGKPIFAVDLWEHAYYLKYQNRRADYLSGIWNLVNWKTVEDLFFERLNIQF